MAASSTGAGRKNGRIRRLVTAACQPASATAAPTSGASTRRGMLSGGGSLPAGRVEQVAVHDKLRIGQQLGQLVKLRHGKATGQ